jgi:LPXTG-motif cell wall-anchored protein
LTVPLVAETLILAAIAYFVGLGLGAILFRRRRRKSYLDYEDDE